LAVANVSMVKSIAVCSERGDSLAVINNLQLANCDFQLVFRWFMWHATDSLDVYRLW